ncbi:phosphatidylinositol-specific phospholipase C [Bacteroides sp.]|uniref:phosphatidylinositol-specific phospholipase C n=1 Tax=Bacteroides sp. TaxID=29523 RepID=UPI003AB23483
MEQKRLRFSYVIALIISVLSIYAYAGNGGSRGVGMDMQVGAGVEKTDWMKYLPDTLPVCKISIPGTHDSGTTRGGRMLKTQAVGISAQLQQGIRAFDIRLEKKNNKLGIFHSYAFQKIYWEDDVLPAFISFLQAHPSETLIVSLKKEGGELQDYASLLSASLSDPANRNYFVLDYHPELALGDCRGKILFLHRDRAMDDYPGAACIGWADNATCLLALRNKDGKEGTVLLQDEYQYESDKDAEKKIEVCINNFNKVSAEPASSHRWGITFVSATGLPSGTPAIFADKINKPVAGYLKKADKRNCGIVFIDFIDRQGGQELVEFLIDSNIR